MTTTLPKEAAALRNKDAEIAKQTERGTRNFAEVLRLNDALKEGREMWEERGKRISELEAENKQKDRRILELRTNIDNRAEETRLLNESISYLKKELDYTRNELHIQKYYTAKDVGIIEQAVQQAKRKQSIQDLNIVQTHYIYGITKLTDRLREVQKQIINTKVK